MTDTTHRDNPSTISGTHRTNAAPQPGSEPPVSAPEPVKRALVTAQEPYPDDLAERERKHVATRRAAAGANGSTATAGVAISGGGIRSATFALGIFQSLARAKLLPHIDYLSTVSGGGYFGSFLGALFSRPETKSIRDVDAVLTNRSSKELRHLRENGRYLAPHHRPILRRSTVGELSAIGGDDGERAISRESRGGRRGAVQVAARRAPLVAH